MALWCDEPTTLRPGWRKRKESILAAVKEPEKLLARAQSVSSLSREDSDFVAALLQEGLPEGRCPEKGSAVVTIGIGSSGGYFFEGVSHLDLIQCVPDGEREVTLRTLAHELHHIALENFEERTKGLSAQNLLWWFCAGEGLAVFFCNNAEGRLSRRIDPSRPGNIGLNAVSWNWMRDNQEEGFALLRSLKKDLITSTDLSTSAQLIQNVLLKPEGYAPFLLAHTWNYFLGCEIWGPIFEAFGKEKLWDTYFSPSEAPDLFHAALRKLGRWDSRWSLLSPA